MQCTIKDERSRRPGSQISAIDEALAEKLCPPKHRIWLKNSTALIFAGGRLKTGASNLLVESWTNDHFLDEVSLAIRKAWTARLDLKILTLLKEEDMK